MAKVTRRLRVAESKIVSVVFVVAVSVSWSALAAPPVEYQNGGFRADTMITVNCELILFGKDVPPVTHEGKLGYWISRDDTSVTCNGITCMTVSTYFPKVVVTPEIERNVRRNVRIKRRAAEVIWRSREANDGLIVLDGQLRRSGDVFQVPVPEESTTVTVRLTGDVMTLTPAGEDMGASIYPLERPWDISREELNELLVRGAYQGMIDALVPGMIVVKGGGYEYSFRLSRAAEVRAALREIPRRAEIESVDADGQPRYRSVETSVATWPSALVGEIVGGE